MKPYKSRYAQSLSYRDCIVYFAIIIVVIIAIVIAVPIIIFFWWAIIPSVLYATDNYKTGLETCDKIFAYMSAGGALIVIMTPLIWLLEPHALIFMLIAYIAATLAALIMLYTSSGNKKYALA